MMIARTAALLCAGLLALAGTTVASAQEGAEFYNGQTVTYIVATEPGGGYDTNGRLVAKYMQKHLPGSTFVVRNMPGAGHVIGANYIAAAPADGLTIGTFNTGLIYAQLKGDEGIKFDLGKMSWIGKLASDPRVILLDKAAGIDSYEALAKSDKTIRFAAAGVGSASTTEITMLVNALKLPVELITGYNGNDAMMAMRRGETLGTLGAKSSLQPHVTDGHGAFVAQIGGSESEVPQLKGLIGDNADGQRVVALIEAQGDISRLTAGPEGIPEDRLNALRAAYDAAVSDPEFLAEAEKIGLPVDPLTGAEVETKVKAALDQTPEMVTFLKEVLED